MKHFFMALAGNTLVRGSFGLVLGAGFIILALRQTDIDEVRRALAGASAEWILASLGCYALGLGMRTLRWGMLVRRRLSIGYPVIGEILILGYAVNNMLPARLGELFRADYMSRRTGAPRPMVFGTIALERLLDAAIVVFGLSIGLLALHGATGVEPKSALRYPFRVTMAVAMAVIAVSVALALISRREWRWAARNPRWIAIAMNFLDGLKTLNRSNLGKLIVLSLATWIAETAALWCMARSIGDLLSVAGVVVLMGIASLSTLLPTAPGYVGSYQLAFAIAFGLIGISEAHGVAAATLTQAVLFGAVTVVGVTIYIARSAQQMLAKQHV